MVDIQRYQVFTSRLAELQNAIEEEEGAFNDRIVVFSPLSTKVTEEQIQNYLDATEVSGVAASGAFIMDPLEMNVLEVERVPGALEAYIQILWLKDPHRARIFSRQVAEAQKQAMAMLGETEED